MKPDFYNDTYIVNKLNLISQIGNALSGGRWDIIISAICGYFISVKKDPNEEYEWDRGGKFGLFIIKVIVYVICPILALLFWGYKGIKKLIKLFSTKPNK